MRAWIGLGSVLVLGLAGCSVDSTNVDEPAKAPNGGAASSSGSSGGSSGSSSGGGTSSGATSSGGSGSSGGSSSSGSGSSGSSGGSGSSSGGAAGGNQITADTTWGNGTTVPGSVTVAAGVTLTITSGATIHVPAGAIITVDGTLVVASGATHAVLTGTGWGGLVIGAGGTLTADTLDLTGATTALDVFGKATWDDGIITGATTPFHVEKGGSLENTKSQVTGTLGTSSIAGAFTASFLSYDSGGNEGIEMVDPSAVFSAEDSTFFGTNDNSGDMIISNQASSIHLAYDEIHDVHCAFHFNDVTSFDVSFMNIHGDSYGFMLYGSESTGTRTIKSSNFETLAEYGLSEIGTNGAIAASGNYFDSSAKIQLSDQEVTVSNTVTSPVTGVGPR